MIKTITAATLGLGLLAGAGFAHSADAHTSIVVAQAKDAGEGTNRERIVDLRTCRGYARAIRAFRSDYGDISNILPNIPTSDPLYTKVVDLKTQLNDARVTAEKRIADQCPNFKG
ncbi:MAG: hypothetical protein M3R53_00350 [Candidatus Eremiobacteraeota bacterium]|nr:hypothetical protein [Candidatus Eremiobacteraeota bacterium]